MKPIHVILMSLVLVTISCTSYQATVKKHEKLTYEAVRVYPEWKYKEPKGKKMITPIIGLSAGAAYGYNNKTTYDGKTYTGSTNAAIWGFGGLIVGAVLNGILFPKQNHRKSRFDISQSEKWVASYNKTTKSDFMIKDKEMNNTLILVPKTKIEELRRQYRTLKTDLNSANPSTNFDALKDWKNQLKGKYSILPIAEINSINEAITQHEQKIADRDLLVKVNLLVVLSNDHSSIQQVNSFKDNNWVLYDAASFNAKQITDKKIDEKLSAIFENTIQTEMVALKKIEKNLNSIGALDAFYNSFDSKYRSFKNRQEIKNVYDAMIEKRTSIVTQSADQVRNKITDANNESQLSEIESQYFSKIDLDHVSVKKLTHELQVRRKQIAEEERRKAIAESNRIIAEKEKRKTLLNSMASSDQEYYLNELDFNTEGLHNERVLKSIYRGDFVNIPFDRDAMRFTLLFNTYINTFASYCASSLPPDKVELTTQECERERVTKNGWGMEIGRQCISWVSVGTGLYASPEMYHAKITLDRLQAADVLGTFWDMITQKDPIGNALNMVEDAQAARSDMIALITMNGCGSPALKRFEENLRLFALNKPAIPLGGYKASDSETTMLSTNQNYDKLVEDLVYDQSINWRINKYQRGSVYDSTISSRDNLGYPSVINAKYLYEGMNGRSVGSVRITLNRGLPECLYFSDSPSVCKTADRKIVARYAKGGYEK